ncbi:MAG: HAD family hydrolase [Desulfatibacillaceae bacterium]
MLEISIPGRETMVLRYLVLDYNGTLAGDGEPLPGVRERTALLSASIEIHVVTADTHGTVADMLSDWPVHVKVLGPGHQDRAKLDHVTALGPGNCAAVGNGANDSLMLKAATVGIAVLQDEGAAVSAILAADVVAPGILQALDLLAKPMRLAATLRV